MIRAICNNSLQLIHDLIIASLDDTILGGLDEHYETLQVYNSAKVSKEKLFNKN